MDLGVPEIAVIAIAVLLLFGYKRLPDASRAIGRSLRIFKGEMKGMKDDDVRAGSPALGPAVPAAAPAGAAAGDLSEQLLEEARAAEARAAELRARAARAAAGD